MLQVCFLFGREMIRLEFIQYVGVHLARHLENIIGFDLETLAIFPNMLVVLIPVERFAHVQRIFAVF